MKVQVTIPIELPNGELYEMPISANVSLDKNWGSDADGRRGEPRYYVEDIILENPKELLEQIHETLQCSDVEDILIEKYREPIGLDSI